MNKKDIRRGDIYYIYDKNSDRAKPAVIVSSDKNIRNGFRLIEIVYITKKIKKAKAGYVKLECRGHQGTAVCDEITPVKRDRIGDFIRSCSEEEIAMINKGLKMGLDLE